MFLSVCPLIAAILTELNNLTAQRNSNNYSYMTRRIGATTFKVKVVYNDTGSETMEDKILRIVRNEVLENGEKCGIMELPQMSRQSERSA